MDLSTEEKARALLVTAGFEPLKMYRLENRYWPAAYVDLRRENPWWLAKTKFGLIEFGMRKRVLSIYWDDTKFRGIITEDDVTKEKDYVHAWTPAKAVEYLSILKNRLDSLTQSGAPDAV